MSAPNEVHHPQLSDVAIIVATRNEGKTLRACIESLLIAAKGEAEIIVVDDGSTDDTAQILQHFGERIAVLNESGKGPGRARNVGIKRTTRRYVAFTDGDCVVAPDWLNELCSALSGRPLTISSAGGIQEVSRSAGSVEKTIGQFLCSVGFVSNYLNRGKAVKVVIHNPTCNVIYDRLAINAVGGFDETLWPCEDLELDLRLRKLGYRALFNPAAVVEHRRPDTYEGLFRMMRRYGFAHAQLVKKRGPCQPIHVLALLPVAFAAILALGGVTILSVGTLFICLGLAFRTSRLLIVAIGMWVFGFYSGVMGGRRIATHG